MEKLIAHREDGSSPFKTIAAETQPAPEAKTTTMGIMRRRTRQPETGPQVVSYFVYSNTKVFAVIGGLNF